MRLTEDCALSVADLEQEWRHWGENLILLGDGASLCHKAFISCGARLAPEAIRFQRASSVALLGEREAKKGNTITASALASVYLRLPQAERELKKRLEQQKV